jgi:hypothetical protein
MVFWEGMMRVNENCCITASIWKTKEGPFDKGRFNTWYGHFLLYEGISKFPSSQFSTRFLRQLQRELEQRGTVMAQALWGPLEKVAQP